MTEATPDSQIVSVPDAAHATLPDVSRRRFLRGAAIAGGGLVAAGLAACAPTGANSLWTYAPASSVTPALASATPAPAATPMTGMAGMESHAPMASGATGPMPAGWTEHDLAGRTVIRRYLGNLAPALEGVYDAATFAKLATNLGVADDYPELYQKPAFMSVGPQLVLTDLLAPLTPTIEAGVKVFQLTIDEVDVRIDELREPIAALGYNSQVPGPTIRVQQGDRVKVLFTNNMHETTSVHFHGVEFDDFFQDGVPFITQLPITPGETYAYEFVARTAGSLMYHSHHNATDQVGRGLLGAFIVEPAVDPVAYDREYIWVSNDMLGGFTINGRGFPATVPIVAAVGETVLVRFMNEGVMMHPFHCHGFAMDVIARDGHPLGDAAFRCDTLGVNPGERFDALIKVDRPGIWAFHCHVLSHVEGPMGMFGMVATLVVVPDKAHVDAIVQALIS